MEERNDLLVTENEEMEEVETHSGLNTGLAMLIGSGLTLAAIAGGKKLKKIWINYKLKKESENENLYSVVDCPKAKVFDEEIVDEQ